MAGIIVIVVVLACAAYQYFSGSLIKSFAMIIAALCASIAAFGFFEPLANLLIARNSLVLLAQPLCFILLFVVVFAILQTIISFSIRQPVDFGFLPERIGRVLFGIAAGFIISGTLLTAITLASSSSKTPYQRFTAKNPDINKPKKAMPNADGFITGWFSMLSKGSFSGKASFAALHPDFLSQLFLNKHKEGVSVITTSDALQLPKKIAAWPAPENLKDSDGKSVPDKSGHKLTIARLGIKRTALKDAGEFTLSQLRLICKEKSDVKNPMTGQGRNIYPVGYLKTATILQKKQLDDHITLKEKDFDKSTKWIDFAFYIPDGSVPVLAEFKQNNVASVPSPVAADKAPAPVPFIPQADCATASVQIKPNESAKIYGIELAAAHKFLDGLTLMIKDPNNFQTLQTANSIKPAQFQDGRFSHVRAELKEAEEPKTAKIKTEAETKAEARAQARAEAIAARQRARRERGPRFRPGEIRSTSTQTAGLTGMLKPIEGYALLSLKCNTPAVGAAIDGRDLPTLIGASGAIHHPVGTIAAGDIDGQTVYELDYCSLTADDDAGCLSLAENGSVAQPFPDSIWITEKAQSIAEFYVLYMVNPETESIILSVQTAGAKNSAGFEKHEAFSLQ